MSSLVEVERNGLPAIEVPSPDQGSERRESNLLHLAWQSRWLILLCMVIGGGVGWAVLNKVTPQYTSVSRIYVERNLPQILTQQLQVGESASYLFTQAELIRSSGVLAAAADSPQLADLESFRDIDNRVSLLKKCIRVVVGNQDDIINVSAELPNGKDAGQIVNAVVDAYVTKYAEKRHNDTLDVLTILRTEKDKRDAERKECEKALKDYRNQNQNLAVQIGSQSVITHRFATLAEEVSQTEISLLEAKARYDRIKAMYDKPSQRMYLLEAASEGQRAMRDMDLENQVQIVERSLTGELAQWGEGHPRVKLLRSSLDELKERLKQQQLASIVAYVDRSRQEYEVLQQKRSELKGAYDAQFKLASDVSNQALELASREEALARAEKVCDILDTRIKELNLTEDVGRMQVSIMEVAGPGYRSYPIPSRFLGIGVVLGAAVGCGLAWLRDLLDHRLKSVDEIASALQLPILGALPHFGVPKGKGQAGRIVALTPRSTAAESVRTLRTALHFGMAGNETKIIVVTSPSPGDGKSTVASNLAIAMSQADQRVLLIDADLRKPTQHKIFEVKSEIGLGVVLSERRPVEDAIIPGVLDSLDLMPCGKMPHNPVELLNNGFFADMLTKLRERYDRIVIDSPPVMPVADARVIAALGDATVLVLRAERSTRRLSVAARNELWQVRATRIGVVVNGVPARKSGYGGYGYGYGYGYGSAYGSPYGQYGYVSYGYGEEEPSENGGRKKRAGLLTKRATEPVTTGADSA
jgi:capsular exopolysaccharide synthesis family protein